MAKIYYELIKKGLKTLEDVPERLRVEVETNPQHPLQCSTALGEGL